MTEPTSDWGRGAWMQTFTGRQFFPLDPRPEDVDPADIAHALSMICRYGGHTRRFYSVAEHCVLLSHAVAPEHALWALLHDATEAYVGDMVRPLKHHMADIARIDLPENAEWKLLLGSIQQAAISRPDRAMNLHPQDVLGLIERVTSHAGGPANTDVDPVCVKCIWDCDEESGCRR